MGVERSPTGPPVARACSHRGVGIAYGIGYVRHTPTHMRPAVAAAATGAAQSRISASTSEWNSRWYSTHSTPAVPSARAHGENSQAAAAKAR
jgi:hypothetical protein